jgi:hypothetical protein
LCFPTTIEGFPPENRILGIESVKEEDCEEPDEDDPRDDINEAAEEPPIESPAPELPILKVGKESPA